MADFVERHANGGNVVELGCGDGALAASVRPDIYAHWEGWDISSEAISKARKRGIPNTKWVVGDIADWPDDHEIPTGFLANLPPVSVDLFVIEESLYYLSDNKQVELIQRCRSSLSGTGTIIVTTHDSEKHRKMINNCLPAKIEKYGQRTYLFISSAESSVKKSQ